jgi:5'-methylthioadenosine phosphorylase
VPFADPYCGRLAEAVAAADPEVRRGGTMVVVEGPRFSTRAESQHYAAQGWSLVNMTGHPEAVLARELRTCYAAIALVTDMDAGVEAGEGVGQAEVFAMFARSIERLKGLLVDVIGDLPDPEGCACAAWADDLELTYPIP